MDYKNLILKTLLIGIFISLSGCADNTPDYVIQGCTNSNALNYNENAMLDDGSCIFTIDVTQENINNSINPIALFKTGAEYPVSIGHNGQMPNQGNTATFRSTFTNLANSNETILPGTIFSKKAYKNSNGSVGELQAFFGMIKREPGYWPEGGDFEYYMTPYDKTKVDTLQMPMGMMPAQIDDMMRGKIMMCAACHADPNSDGDFVFNYGTSSKFGVTQADINKSINPITLFKTGAEYPVSIGHNGQMPDQGNTATFRSTFTNLASLSSPIAKGTIFTKKAYKNNSGVAGELQAFFGMIKREPGYWPEGGDFEYYMTPYDKTMIDTLQMPMGMMPANVDNMMRGKIMMCASCHADSSSSGDYIFNY
ncbi:MAG: hypothetical protein CVT95_10090 [Bacteroidetes bacterium HGW-Bacteroidetes-12]|nr:MAG: hypothetical protein CVT95_10090 [Bacteroidetes bacterium HGW-Bacteroidetes-12]